MTRLAPRGSGRRTRDWPGEPGERKGDEGGRALSAWEGTFYLGLGFVPRSRVGFPEPGAGRTGFQRFCLESKVVTLSSHPGHPEPRA